jgi:choline dehydrogenase
MDNINNLFIIEYGNLNDGRVQNLLKQSEEYAYSLYPAENVYTLTAAQLQLPSVHFLVAQNNSTGQLLGCGAVVLDEKPYAEIKRMFVTDAARRQGVAKEILLALESMAQEKHISLMRLETGPRQIAALAFYRRFGYRECHRFGDYPENPFSIFMEKLLC